MPTMIQELVLEAAVSRLSAISIANGRSRDIPLSRIYTTRLADTLVTPPALQIIQHEDEVILEDSVERYNCRLPFVVMGVDDMVRAPDPKDIDGWARLMLADIQWAMGRKLSQNQPYSEITVTNYSSGLTESVTLQFHENGSGINAGDPQPGRTFCHCFFWVIYVRSQFDAEHQ